MTTTGLGAALGAVALAALTVSGAVAKQTPKVRGLVTLPPPPNPV